LAQHKKIITIIIIIW